MQSIVANVPYEVWRNITGFLTPQEVKNLHSVNRPLFLIALEERYRFAYIGDLEDDRTIRSFQRLVDQLPARYVRELHMCPCSLEQLLVPGGLRGTQDLAKDDIFVQPEAPATLLGILANMPSVTKYHFQCGPIDDSLMPLLSSYILAAWSSFGSNLRHLQLSVRLEVFSGVTESVKLDNLEELIVDISHAQHWTDISFITLLEFINNHCDKLKLFALNFSRHAYQLHLFLQKLGPMPLLENFSFSNAYIRKTLTSELSLMDVVCAQ